MPKTLFASLFLMLSLSGCSTFPYNHDSKVSSNTQRDWYPLPKPGDQIAVTNKTTGTESTVTVIDAYHAASGRTCSLYSVNVHRDPGNPSGLACRDGNLWVNVPLIVNPDAQPASG